MLYNPYQKRTYSECDRWRVKTIARIAALRPDLVIVGQSDQASAGSVGDHDWGRATVATLGTLREAGTKVTFFLDTPASQRDVPTCVGEQLDDVRLCIIARERSFKFPKRRAAVAQAVTAAGFETIDPANWLCAPAACPVIVGNVLVYRDESHMTAVYSRWLAPMVQPLLTPPTTS